MQVDVLNGVNLGMLGVREPGVYGTVSLGELESRIYGWARGLGLIARCLQTDHEGEYVQAIHEGARTGSALIVNPGAWTHYAYAIRDALAIVSAPVVEVHLSDVDGREEWRRVSVISDVVSHRVTGQGPDGYRLALEWIAARPAPATS
jgi:3-dehydroquinate dehydratase-2